MTSQEFTITRLQQEIRAMTLIRESAEHALEEFEDWQAENPEVVRWHQLISHNDQIRASLQTELEWVRNNSILVLAGDDVEAVVRQVEYIDADAEMPRYLPTQEEIRKMCLQIQSEWDAATERARRTGSGIPERMDYGRVVKVGE